MIFAAKRIASRLLVSSFIVSMALIVSSTGQAGESGTTATLSLNQDAFFGQWNQAMLGTKVSDSVTFNAYGIIWANPFLVSGQGQSTNATNNWTEFGLGATFMVMEGLSATTLIGVTSGSLLSGGRRESLDGYVPNVTLNYSSTNFESQAYSGFYMAAIDNGTRNDYLHFWVYGGYKITENYTLGISHEQLDNNRSDGVAAGTVYRWLGPYVNVTVPNANAGIRFAFGTDSATGARNGTGFYKLSFNFGF